MMSFSSEHRKRALVTFPSYVSVDTCLKLIMLSGPSPSPWKDRSGKFFAPTSVLRRPLLSLVLEVPTNSQRLRLFEFQGKQPEVL